MSNLQKSKMTWHNIIVHPKINRKWCPICKKVKWLSTYPDCWGLSGVSPTLANLGNDHEFISEEYYLHWYEAFWEAQSKVMRGYAQNGQYHTIVESPDS